MQSSLFFSHLTTLCFYTIKGEATKNNILAKGLSRTQKKKKRKKEGK